MEALVQNLLKMAKLDAGSVVLEKRRENVAEILQDLKPHFAHRAKDEQKEIVLSGEENVFLCCDCAWVSEAVGLLVGLPLYKSLYSRMITSYFGLACKLPWGMIAICILVTVLAVWAAVYGPAKRICAVLITEAVNES